MYFFSAGSHNLRNPSSFIVNSPLAWAQAKHNSLHPTRLEVSYNPRIILTSDRVANKQVNSFTTLRVSIVFGPSKLVVFKGP